MLDCRTSAASTSSLTAIDLEYRAGLKHVRLVFGTPAHTAEREQTFGITRRTVYFSPDSVVAIDLWEGAYIANRGGEARTRTRHRACYVLRAGRPGESLTRIPQVSPGAHILIHTEGVRRCKFLLAWLEELARRCDPGTLGSEFYEAKGLRVLGLVPEHSSPAAIGFPVHAAAR